MIPRFSVLRLVRTFFLKIQVLDIWPGHFRYLLLRLGGVKVGKNCHIGGYNLFDTIRPDLITIGEHTTISTRCVILSHFVHPKKGRREWSYGKVHIGANCFIGANVIICQPCIIGDNAALAAGAVVNRDIPSKELWGGVPAKFIKKIE